MRVDDVMEREVLTCREDESLAEAARVTEVNPSRTAPVVDGLHRVVGIVTRGDICRAAATLSAPPVEQPASAVMTRGPRTIGPDRPLDMAHRAMQRHGIRQLPVVDPKGRLVGMLTLDDLGRAAESDMRLRLKNLHAEQVVRTMAATYPHARG